MTILVFEPGTALVGAEASLPEVRIQPLAASTGQREDPAAQVRHRPSVAVVKPDDDVAARLDQRQEAFEASVRIAGVVEDAVAEHDIELRRLETRLEQIHLHKPHARQAMLAAEAFGEHEGIETHIGANHTTAGQSQKVRELSGAA